MTILKFSGCKYREKLQSAANRGESLETNIFSVLKKRIEEKAIALEKTMEELRRSNVDLEQFAYVASHDWQEP